VFGVIHLGAAMMTGMPGNMTQKVTEILQSMPTSQLYDILVQFKSLLQQNPDQARTLLLSNPPVAYALLQAQIALGFVSPMVAKVRKCSISLQSISFMELFLTLMVLSPKFSNS
jgi:cleavage stimulation factor subunit 2